MKKIFLILLTLLVLCGCSPKKITYDWKKGDFIWNEEFGTQSVLESEKNDWIDSVQYGDEYIHLSRDNISYGENIGLDYTSLGIYYDGCHISMGVSKHGYPTLNLTETENNKTVNYTFEMNGKIKEVERYSYPKAVRIYDEDLTLDMDKIAETIGNALSTPESKEMLDKFIDMDKLIEFLVTNENLDVNKINIKPIVRTSLEAGKGFLEEKNDYYYNKNISISVHGESSYKGLSIYGDTDRIGITLGNDGQLDIDLETGMVDYQGYEERLIVKSGKAYFSPYVYLGHEGNPDEGFRVDHIVNLLDSIKDDDEALTFVNKYIDVEELTRIILELNS